jgi:hypothetical protein
MQTNTKIFIGLGLAAAIAAYFVFRPKKNPTNPNDMPSDIFVGDKPTSQPKPLPFEVKSCPDGEKLVGKNCVPDKALLLRQYQDYSYNKKLQVYDSGSSTIFK